jgi:hypothetical protein
MNLRSLCRLGLWAWLLGSGLPAGAQWLSQTNVLKPGWNAVYMHVDASYTTLTNLIAADVSNPILEVWMWAPAVSTMQFVQSPLNPLDTGSQWVSWNRSSSAASLLQRLAGNASYLVRVGTNVTTYTWSVTGKPVAPKYQWTTTGLNFLGFPTVPAGPPNFDAFLSQAPDLQQNAEIYQYVGGDLGATNPVRVFALRTTLVKRGQAFWIRSGNVFNRYFGPFEGVFSNPRGIEFGASLSSSSFRLRNLTASNLTVTLRLVASESAPSGQTNLAGLPPLLVRGSLNTTNLTYSYTNLTVSNSRVWTLAGKGQPGSEVEVVLGLNRAAITNNAGALLGGLLRLTDSLGFSQIEVPVTATVDSAAGLWVGGAVVTQVGAYLKSYQREAGGTPVIETNGAYSMTSVNTNLGAVAAAFPLRLIVHNPAAGNAVLLQRVFVGVDANTNSVVAQKEAALNPTCLSQARRISASHLPWTSTNLAWAFNGRFRQATNLTATVTLDYTDQASNPFLHTYHPDHDNLDDTFSTPRPRGSESYTVQRNLRLSVLPPANDFASLTAGGQTITGSYGETISVLGLARSGGTNDTRNFEVRGVFSLNRISEVPTLTTTP